MAIKGTSDQLKAPIRLGMVGGGEGSLIGAPHRLAARLDGQFVLAAGAFSSSAERSRETGANLGLDEDRCYRSYAEMAEAEARRHDGIEAVSIVTPNHLHVPVAKAFLEAGIHVICDKPLSDTLEAALELESCVKRSGKLFCLTHNYSAYAMVRHAKGMIAAGELGDVRSVQVEYPCGWLAEPIEQTGFHKQAAWRTDPKLAGAGAIGDIGTHAWHLARTISGLELEELSAELSSLVEGRRIDDHAQVLLRFRNGARGILWASQIALGLENGLKIRVYGSKGGLEWTQMDPEVLIHTPLGRSRQHLLRGTADTAGSGERLSRIPGGHPEGYFEAFANVYRDAAKAIRLSRGGVLRLPDDHVFATIGEGVEGMRFVDACQRSSASNARWTPLAS